ncbi:MAG: hypothetical protein HYY84_07810 [Deltaproteobacteria bacterium]|nr:hypothetical protein [Deltaproteobacteria bacterium]
MRVRRTAFLVMAVLVACEQGPQSLGENSVSEPLAERTSGRVGLIVGSVRTNDRDLGADTVRFDGFFARHRGISAMATIDALDVRAVADVLGHRAGECWIEAQPSTERGEIELLEVGALSAQGAATERLDAKTVPRLLDRISGTLYKTAHDVTLGVDRRVRVRSMGGASVGPFEVRLEIPSAMNLVAVRGWTAGRALELAWNTDGSVGDAVVLSIRAGQTTSRCVVADKGDFTVDASYVGEGREAINVAATRVRLSSFSATGLQSAHAAVLVEENLSVSRGE